MTESNQPLQNYSDFSVLVVEDDSDIRDLIIIHLTRTGFSVTNAGNGDAGLEICRQKKFHLLVLDWMLPGTSGIDLLQQKEKTINQHTPVIMVTAKTRSEDIVNALEAGASDYMVKPFDPAVLIARCKSLLRRIEPCSDVNQIKLSRLSIDADRYKVFCCDTEINLTRFEFRLLLALAQQPGKVLNREKLIDLIQGEGIIVVDRTVDTHVFALRKKLGECSEMIETVRGIGYRLKNT